MQILACTVSPTAAKATPNDAFPGTFQTVYEGVPVTLIPRDALPATADISLEPSSAVVGQLAEWMTRNAFDVAHVLHTMRMGSAVAAMAKINLPYLVTLTDFFLPCFRINRINLDGQLCDGPEQGTRCAQDCLVGPWNSASLQQRYQMTCAFLNGAAVRICPSDYVAHFFRQAFDRLDFTVLPHGVDLVAAAATVAVEKSYPETIVLGYVGGIVPQKGLDILLSAFKKVDSDRLRLEIIGGFFGDEHYQQQVRKLIDSDSRIHLVGRVEPHEVFSRLRQFDVLCLPSLVPESYSLVFQEAAAVGVPAVVSDLGAPAERIRRDGGGAVAAAGDVDAWTRLIRSLLDSPALIGQWTEEIVLPLRLEEEGFLYESLYRQMVFDSACGEQG